MQRSTNMPGEKEILGHRLPMRADQQVRSIIRQINRRLQFVFARYARSAGRQHQIARRLSSAVGEFTLRRGAKRTRGLLTVIGYLANPRNRVDKNIITIAAAYEVLQAYLLIHDDIIDDDDVRRGRPTLHRLFERAVPAGVSRTVREKIGRDIAIIAGDVAADMVQRIILETSFPDSQKLRALALIDQTLHTTYAGQVLDILSLPQHPPRLNDQILRYQLKTARYSIASPFMLGAELGLASFQRNAFIRFAEAAGVGFQLADDIANVFGVQLARRSSDIRSGKVTLLMTLALQSNQHRPALLRLLARPARTADDVRHLVVLLEDSGGLARARAMVSREYERAERLISRLDLSEKSETLLRWLVARFKQAN